MRLWWAGPGEWYRWASGSALGWLSGDGDDAEITGVVDIECPYLVFDEIGERYPVVWPASTSYDESEGTVALPNGDAVADGDAVRGGGGYRFVDDV